METSHITKGMKRSSFHNYLYDKIETSKEMYYQLLPEDLAWHSIEEREGILSNLGALVIETGEFTGRSPQDRFIVKDELTENAIDWNKFNQPLHEKYYRGLYDKMLEYLKEKRLWIRDCYVCAKDDYRLYIRVINENPCCNLFAYNMFLRPGKEELINEKIEWHLLQLPHFFADPSTDGVNRKNFVILNFTEKIILIGGTQYTGEIKKAVFSILNFVLPVNKNVLSMHCAANVAKDGDTALFFGLSGTGKTTLSADPQRRLIGDDEHGWDDNSIFNFEGGCYAKVINLNPIKEPAIYNAIKFGSIVENVSFMQGTNIIDFASKKITENTRVSYPINYISNAVIPSVGKVPKNIFFLTADAFGVLPLISKLTLSQAMYHFISGYTSKVAGTEEGVNEPKPTFSACFGAPFMPLNPGIYAEMLGEKIKQHNVNVWLVNTGWSGGPYGTGSRIKLEYTRAIVTAALEGQLDNVVNHPHPIFKIMIPSSCPGIPSKILNPQLMWKNKVAYTETANKLAGYFISNFKTYANHVSKEIVSASPEILNTKS